MEISPDWIIYGKLGPFPLNATLVYTWVVMILITLGSWLVTRNLTSGENISRWQNLLEVLVGGMRTQIREITLQEPDQYLPFLGTLFVFILVCNVLSVVPGFHPPTGSLSTTTALALSVLVAVPAWGIAKTGFKGHLRQYLEPTVLMLPFNVIGEFSRTLALAVRLFGNVMSGSMIAAVFLAFVPLLFPIIMQVLGLITGVIQAYIFAVLAAVYIGAATRVEKRSEGPNDQLGALQRASTDEPG